MMGDTEKPTANPGKPPACNDATTKLLNALETTGCCTNTRIMLDTHVKQHAADVRSLRAQLDEIQQKQEKMLSALLVLVNASQQKTGVKISNLPPAGTIVNEKMANVMTENMLAIGPADLDFD